MRNRISDALIRLFPAASKLRRFARTLIEVDIDKTALLHNAAAFSKYTGKPVAPVLKSNAYGHGLVEVATVLDSSSNPLVFPFFVVDSYHEAVTLRQNNIRTPILVIGYTFVETIVRSRLKNVAFAITSIEALKKLTEAVRDGLISPKNIQPIKIHLKIDTGMHRQGIDISEIESALKLISESGSKIILEGIASHLAESQNDQNDFTAKQIAVWNSCVDKIKMKVPTIKYFHLSNTDGHKLHGSINMNVSRLGLGLYGYSDRPELERELDLRPVLSVRSVIAQVRKIKAGETVGYNCSYRAPRDMTVAVVPAGYNEGIDRRLSQTDGNNKSGATHGYFTVRGVACPIVGLVSMNMTIINVGSVNPAPELNDEVVIVSNIKSDVNSARAIASNIRSIVYEVLVKIPSSLRRVVR